MHFLYPSMLWGLLALLIPIAVHLFNFRRHKLVYFSNTNMLRNIQQENAKTRKLKYFVTLCLRCLFIVGLVLAFAFPYHPENEVASDASDHLVGLYLDNSMSMKGQSQRTTLLEDARESARDLVRKLNPSNRYVLMTNTFEVQNEYPMSQDEMLDQLERMHQDGSPVAMGEVIDRFAMLQHQHGFAASTLFVYSDFQRNTFDLSAAAPDTSMRIVAVPMLPEFQSNVYVDSVWLASPIMQAGLTNEVNVRVVNEGEREVKGLPINFMMNGRVAASSTVDIEKGGSADLAMQFMVEQAGEQKCSIALVDSPIVFDDEYHFVLSAKPRLSIVEIGEDASPCALIFDEDAQYDYRLMTPTGADLTTLAKAQFIIVNESATLNETLQQTLLDCASEGASVVFFPNADEPKTNQYAYQKLGLVLSELDKNPSATENLAVQHAFFSDMILDLPQDADLPKTLQHIGLRSASMATPLLTLQNGDVLLLEESVGKGEVFVLATCLDPAWSDLADNALFVPMMVKMALVGGRVGDIAYTIGKDKILEISDVNLEGDRNFVLCNEDRSFETMPASEMRANKLCLFFADNLPEAGFYELRQNDSLLRVMAWNEDRQESRMDFAAPSEIEETFKQSGLQVSAVLDVADFANDDLVQAMAHQSKLWRWFVLLALLALLGEVAVLRFWK